MSTSPALVIEAILALVMLIKKHQDAKAVSAEEIDAELARVKSEFEKRKASDLPDV
jgi:hypothetical protein